MHNVLKSSLLDVTIDKLSIVADFKEGIKKDEKFLGLEKNWKKKI